MTKPFALFYHIWCPAHPLPTCRLIVDEQLKRVFRSGLPNHADIFCCISGAHEAAIREFVAGYEWLNICKATLDENKYEGLTLEFLYDHCINSPELVGVGYIHTKGMRLLSIDSSVLHFRCVNSWRHFLEWGVIDKWRDATRLIGEYDAVGVNYLTSPWPHFGGNFWWANAKYIRKLIRPEVGRFPPGNYDWVTQDEPERSGITNRLDFERWICLNIPKCFSFYGSPFMKDGTPLPLGFHNLYENDIEPYYRYYGG